jgi:multiple sugar transport system substrate-binding protein
MKRTRLLAALAAVPLALAACGGNGDGGGGEGGEASGEITYWLWDANQLPAYQACAEAFSEANPDITVTVEQYGWDDYWNKVTTGFVSNTGPDVFTDHLSRYPQFAAQNQLLPLDDYVEQDELDLDIYQEGLADLWVDQEGNRYGLPKDWDTIAIFYNQALVEEAGLTEEDLQDLTWNPDDGGTYEDVIARLTVDANGVRGDEPGFDKDNVAVYGLGLENSGGGYGQTQWSMYTATTGWTHTDENPWGNEYNYDDPNFQDTIAWWRGLIEKGYMPSYEEATGGINVTDTFAAGKAALNTNGSWMIGTYTGFEGIEVGIAPTPVGPDGERASMFNGLADSISRGTDSPDAAWEWVKFLASQDCQDIVAEQTVVFPAIQESTDAAVEAFAAEGIDVTAFNVHVDEGTTFLYPITDNAADVDATMQAAMERVMLFQAEPDSLTQANEQVNALFQ